MTEAARLGPWPPSGREAIAASLPVLMRLEASARLLRLPAPNQAAPSRQGARGLQARGMEHAESRLYQPGDDARNIDWKVTARHSRPYTKLYRQEREHPIWVLVDCRRSMFFATRGAFKSVFAIHTAALLVWAIQMAGDRAGCMCLTDVGWLTAAPRRGRMAVQALLQMLVRAGAAALDDAPPGPQNPLATEPRAQPRGDAVYALSDFADVRLKELLMPWTQGGPPPKRIALAHIFDPLEAELPSIPEARIVTASGERWTLDTRTPARERHRQGFLQRTQELASQARALSAAFLQSTTTDQPLDTARGLLNPV